MSDIIHRLNALANCEHDDLSIGYEAAEEIIRLRAEVAELRHALAKAEVDISERDTAINLMNHTTESLWRERDELRAQLAAHEKACAGTWVPVEERLPEVSRVVPAYCGSSESLYRANWITKNGEWMFVGITHWLDARLPGGVKS